MCTVDWIPLASTAVGAAVALIGTVLADVLRSRGQRDRDNRADRRQSYLDYVLALNAAHSRLRQIAGSTSPIPDPDLHLETGRAIRDNDVYVGREKMLMSADRSVLGAAERALLGLLGLRDAVRTGARTHTVEYHAAYHAYAESIWDLRRAIRADLGGADLAPSDLEKPSWDSRATCSFCQAQASLPQQAPPPPQQAPPPKEAPPRQAPSAHAAEGSP